MQESLTYGATKHYAMCISPRYFWKICIGQTVDTTKMTNDGAIPFNMFRSLTNANDNFIQALTVEPFTSTFIHIWFKIVHLRLNICDMNVIA